MLTKTDLNQISTIIQKETKPVSRDIKTMKKDIVHIRKDTKDILGFLDEEYLELRKRIERIEEHLHLSA